MPCSRGGACSQGVPGPGGLLPGGLLQGGAWWKPPPEWPLLRAVRILLECILVKSNLFDHRWKFTIGKCVDLRLLTTETRFAKNFSNSNITETNYNSQLTLHRKAAIAC